MVWFMDLCFFRRLKSKSRVPKRKFSKQLDCQIQTTIVISEKSTQNLAEFDDPTACWIFLWTPYFSVTAVETFNLQKKHQAKRKSINKTFFRLSRRLIRSQAHFCCCKLPSGSISFICGEVTWIQNQSIDFVLATFEMLTHKIRKYDYRDWEYLDKGLVSLL